MQRNGDPFDRWKWYGDRTLFESPAVRMRIEVGHRPDMGAFLVVRQVEQMPGRRLEELESFGGPATETGADDLHSEITSMFEDFLESRLRVQEQHGPFEKVERPLSPRAWPYHRP